MTPAIEKAAREWLAVPGVAEGLVPPAPGFGERSQADRSLERAAEFLARDHSARLERAERSLRALCKRLGIDQKDEAVLRDGEYTEPPAAALRFSEIAPAVREWYRLGVAADRATDKSSGPAEYAYEQSQREMLKLLGDWAEAQGEGR